MGVHRVADSCRHPQPRLTNEKRIKMKNRYILLAAACLLCACEPVEDDATFDPIVTTQEALSEAFSFTQTDKDGNPAEDGNYFTYTTSPAQIVKVYNLKSDGSQNLLATGASGSFTIAPSRGSDPNQKFYVVTYNSDGTEVVSEKTANVYVKQELTLAEKLFCSSSGRKVYKWNTTANKNGYVWGNDGWIDVTTASGADFVTSGHWWGVASEDDWAGQLGHSVSGQLTGEESFDAYMVFTEDGTIEKYDANGTKLNETTYEIIELTENTQWAKYRIKTGENSILWPFEMNANTNFGAPRYVTEFDVVQISATSMVLVHPDDGDYTSEACKHEVAYWNFKAVDGMGVLAGLDGTGSKKWTWNTTANKNGYVWGNDGYIDVATASGADFVTSGHWWGVAKEDDWAGQLGHSVSGQLTGEESFDAYMEFTEDGRIIKYDAQGNKLNETEYELVEQTENTQWAKYKLKTGENSILWPFEMNAKTNFGAPRYVTEFDVIITDEDTMTLVFPDGGDYYNEDYSREVAYWNFKAKK